VLALTRLGSAARADPIHQAGTALGKLLRTLFLCDYLSNELFRREVLRILNRGESVHTLQKRLILNNVKIVTFRPNCTSTPIPPLT
jgi:TnpA family transposase